MTRLTKNQHLHRDNQLGRYTEQLGGKDYLAVIDIKSIANATPTIYNVSTTDANWTAIATGLTNVISWRLVEKSGADFWFAYTAAPTTYVTGFGWVSNTTGLTDIYVKRPTTTNVDMQLEVWSVS